MRKPLLAALLCPFSICGAFAQIQLSYTGSGSDDSPAINALIGSTAAAASNKTITITGPIRLRTAIRIPTGTKNLNIIGRGPTGGRAPVSVMASTAIFVIGRYDFSVTSPAPLSNLAAMDIKAPGEGQDTITIRSPKGLNTGWYVVYDDQSVTHNSYPSTIFHNAMLVKVLSFDKKRALAILDRPLNRAYTKAPKMAYVEGQVTENITIRGFELDGRVPGSTTGVGGFVAGGFVVGFQGLDLKARYCSSGILKLGVSRDFLFDGIDIADSTGNLAAGGEGYGIYILRSQNGLIRNSRAATMRHGFVMHSGTTDVIIENSVGLSTVGSDFDVHGMDERRITFRYCSGTSIGIGNDAWNKGGSGHRVENCDVGTIYIGPTTSGSVVDSSFVRAFDGLDGRNVLVGSRPGLPVGQWTFDNCHFQGTRRLLMFLNDKVVQGLTFRNCSWLSQGSVFEAYQISGNLSFDQNTFEGGNMWDGSMLHFSSQSGVPLHVKLTNSTFRSGTAGYAVGLGGAPFNGSVELGDNVFYSTVAVAFHRAQDPYMSLTLYRNHVWRTP
ncbi:MAG TPA: right-handed parallel beta-helix repeat-containing protein [Fimbriimonadaceae bacterium]|nr:right-handed parallel beta-helix repeat-containing protein [Fimbriimonadaceae bacterium]